MVTYQISVYASAQTLADRKKLFERIVTLPAHVEFEYSLIVKSMHILYGTKCIIQITIQN